MSEPADVGEGTPLRGPVKLSGTLECRPSPEVQCITLVGRTATGELLHLRVPGSTPADFPPRLEGAEVEHLGGSHYRISSAGRLWTLSGRCYLHTDVTGAFYRAVRPRPVPLMKRLLWRLVLAAARTRVVQWWLARSNARA